MDPIRLLISDIDGTMVRRDKTLPDENVAAVRQVTARGVPVSLISARPVAGILPIARALDLPGPFGAFNGGTIFDAAGTVLTDCLVPQDTARALIDLYRAHGVTWWFFTANRWLTSDPGNSHTGREVQSSGLQGEEGDFVPLLDQCHKVVAVCEDPDLMSLIEAEARELAGNAANVIRSQSYYLDVTAPRAHKGFGIEALAQLYGVPLGQVAVLGDQANDIPMFRRAGLAIAMGQAGEAVRAEAHCAAGPADDAGVADAIRRFVLPRL